jgi:FSR family fosmidomycin resistance protein-like MFS transporter
VMSVLILVLLGAFSISHADDQNAINAGGAARGFRGYLQDCATLLRNKALILVACSSAFRTMTQVGLLTFLPVYLAYELGYSPFLVGTVLTTMQVAGFIASPIGGHLSDKMGRKRVVTASMTLTAVMLVGMVLAGKSAAFVVFIALVGFFLYAMRSVLQAWAVESVPTNLSGAGVGIQFGITAMGSAIAPALFGVIADAYDLYTGFYFLAGMIAASNFLIFFIPNGEVRQVNPAVA